MLCAVVVYHRVVPEEEGGHFEEITLNLYRVDCLRLRGLMRVADKKKERRGQKKKFKSRRDREGEPMERKRGTQQETLF